MASNPHDLSRRPPLRFEATRLQRQKLRDEIEEMSVTILAKRSQLNALSPVFYLPPEILERIFSYAAHSDVPRVHHGGDRTLQFSSSEKETSRTIINITHVCIRWRKVAIQSNRLWTCPPLEFGPTWTETMLERSGSSALSIEAHRDGPILTPQMVQLIDKNLPRVQTLHISTSHDILDQLLQRLAQPAPLLRSAILEMPDTENLRIVVRMLQDLFAGNAPELEKLVLTHCTVPWSSMAFQNLVILHISLPRGDPLVMIDGVLTLVSHHSLLPSMPQLFEIFAASPLLESLGLRNALPLPSSASLLASPHQPDTVPLSEIQDLWLQGDIHECCAFMSHLTFPMPIILQLDIDFEDIENAEADCAVLLEYFSNHFRHSDCLDSFRSSSLQWGNVGGETELNVDECRITMPTPDNRRTYTHFLHEFFAIFPLEIAVSLIICDDGDFGSNDFLRVFAQEHLLDIISVAFQAGKIELFCSALCECTPQPAPGRAFLLCPRLKFLQFDQFDFSEISHQERKAFQENLVDLLQQRKENASPIEQVMLNYCPGVDETWINTFRVVEGTNVRFYSYEDILRQS